MRDKLIELIDSGRKCLENRGPFDECTGCKYITSKACDLERLADYLISNGVTVQQWVPVHLPLPKEGE